MGFKFLKINLLIIGIFFVCPYVLAASTKNIDVNVDVYVCDNNGVCDLGQNENYINCPNDCPAPICNNNGTCESGSGEDTSNCPADCPPPVCNHNDVCDTGENNLNCADDCHEQNGAPILPTDRKSPLISHILVFSISRTNANISWTTDELAYCQLDWGDSTEYKSGSTAEVSFFTNHSTELPNLSPGTNYYFQISCYDRSHNLGRVTNEWFATLPLSPTPHLPSPGGDVVSTTGNQTISPAGKPDGSGVTSSLSTQTTTTVPGIIPGQIGQTSSTGLGIWQNKIEEIASQTGFVPVEAINWIYDWWLVILIIIIIICLIWWFVFCKGRKRKE